MRWAWLALVLLVTSTLAGCIGGDDAPVSAPDDTGSGTAVIVEVENDLDGCSEVALAVFRDRAVLQALLPQGFTAADTRTMLGAPVPTGMGVAAMGVITCEEASLADGALGFSDLGIIIEPPSVHGVTLDTASVELYLVAMYTDSPRQIDAFGAVGLDIFPATADAAVASAGPIVQGGSWVSDHDGRFLTVDEAVAPPGASEPGVTRLWQATEHGLAVFDYAYSDLAVATGVPAGCQPRPGSVVSEVLGSEPCSTPGAQVVMFSEAAFEGTFRFLEGAGPGVG